MNQQMDEIDQAQQKEIDDLKHKDEIHDLLLQQYKDHNDTLRNMIYGGMAIFVVALILFGSLIVVLKSPNPIP